MRDIIAIYKPDLMRYEEMYRDLHQHPGLSLSEHHAARTAAWHLRDLAGFEVRTRIGGTGLIGVLRNGSGRTVLLRADMDGLPVEELTGLPYASRERQVDAEDGVEKPVMHACGHDFHVTALLAAASTLHAAQQHWSGTLVVLFQPNEERGGGARAMVDDGLYDEERHACPLPDVVLGQHVLPDMAGRVGSRRGPFGSSADSFELTLYGRGGHASAPHRSIDPIVLAASVILRLQTIVSREVDPSDFAVLTVASIHAGLTENVIADSAVLKINIRAVRRETRDRLIAAIKRIVKAECEATGVEREAKLVSTHSLPLLINDDTTTAQLEGPFAEHFGDMYTADHAALGGSEDFSTLATECPNKHGGKGVPYSFWVFGGTDPTRWKEAERKGTLEKDIPNNHSAYFAPAIQPTLRTGVDAALVAALSFLT
ncbi:MAG: hypothetical protein M1818_001517 [Claussenomyces sp. TS43310]|nr:MAG: hypothetical protein M1818_001517 [Claussenomyces sp. TS43310]